MAGCSECGETITRQKFETEAMFRKRRTCAKAGCRTARTKKVQAAWRQKKLQQLARTA